VEPASFGAKVAAFVGNHGALQQISAILSELVIEHLMTHAQERGVPVSWERCTRTVRLRLYRQLDFQQIAIPTRTFCSSGSLQSVAEGRARKREKRHSAPLGKAG
jgi:hypothetical protein